MTTETTMVFPSGSELLVGMLLSPDDTTTRRPTVLVTGSWLTVKEQMPLTYARRLIEEGFNAFVFDFAGFGASGGEPRQLEMPQRKVRDLDAAARFVRSLSTTAGGEVGLLSICASAQYGVQAIGDGAPIASLAFVSGWFHDADSVAPFYGNREGVARRLADAEKATRAYLDAGEVVMEPAYRDGDENSAMFIHMDYYSDPERGALPTWRNEMAVMSWSHWLTYDGLAAAARVRVPTIAVHSDGSVFPENVRRVLEAIEGPTQLVWSEGFQTDFYDQPHQVDQSLKAVVSHFRSTLQSKR